MKAAGDKIKIIYGVEGYYTNDVDDKLAVYGDLSGTLDDEIVIFDIETTGLSSVRDTITEIGAVIMKDGREIDRFQTFADPGMHIPESISQLTGITDEDVQGAPGQEQAVRAFLQFAGNRPIVAHNASFDVGFIYEACLRYGIDFEPGYIDTLAMARAMLPELRSHKLDVVPAGIQPSPGVGRRGHRGADLLQAHGAAAGDRHGRFPAQRLHQRSEKKQLHDPPLQAPAHHHPGPDPAGRAEPVQAHHQEPPGVLQALPHHPQEPDPGAPGGASHRLGL
jgi:hypothetical protein